MSEELETVRLRILGENYTIACEPEDRELLKNAATLLDEQADKEHRQDPLLDAAKVFMLAALKLAIDLMRERRESERGATETIDNVRSVRRRMERRLKKIAAESAESAEAQTAS